jgi:hypothetical protein
MIVHFKFKIVKQDFSRERIAVCVHSARRQADNHIAFPDSTAVYDPILLYDADDESGEVILFVFIEIGHLRRLSADKSATILLARNGKSIHDGCHCFGNKPARSDVIEKEKRCRPLSEDIVYAVIYEALTDGVMPSRHKGDFELGSNSVRARNENGRYEIILIEFEKASEQADIRQDIFIESPSNKPLNLAFRPVRGINIHAGILVCPRGTIFFFAHISILIAAFYGNSIRKIRQLII